MSNLSVHWFIFIIKSSILSSFSPRMKMLLSPKWELDGWLFRVILEVLNIFEVIFSHILCLIDLGLYTFYSLNSNKFIISLQWNYWSKIFLLLLLNSSVIVARACERRDIIRVYFDVVIDIQRLGWSRSVWRRLINLWLSWKSLLICCVVCSCGDIIVIVIRVCIGIISSKIWWVCPHRDELSWVDRWKL